MTDVAKLDLKGETHEFPVLHGSEGPSVFDIRKLYGATDMFTFDPGFKSTASCESGLTFIDGEEGVLLHRGYPIGQLAEHSNFMEVCYLLLNGDLPGQDELDKFSWTITRHTMLHEQLRQLSQWFPPRCASDGGDVRRGRRAERLLSRQHRYSRSTASHDFEPPPDREDADDRGLGL